MGTESHDASNWHLFIEFATRSLKAVLLPSGKDLGSVPTANSVQLKETYENLRTASGSFTNTIKNVGFNGVI